VWRKRGRLDSVPIEEEEEAIVRVEVVARKQGEFKRSVWRMETEPSVWRRATSIEVRIGA
jgi:hypothetical protein